jgi:1,2-diacylglycerol 3-alpha-glucosyltransferase
MRIAMFTETYLPYKNGVVSHVVMLKKMLEAMGHEVLVVTVSARKKVKLEDGVLHCPGIRVERQYGYRIIAPGTFRARMDEVRAFQPDVIHIHNEYSVGLFALKAAKYLGVPIVYSIHMDFDKYLIKIPGMTTLFRPLVSRYLRRFVAASTSIVSMSPKSKMYVRRTGVERDVLLVPNAVEVDDYMRRKEDEEEAAALRERLGISPDAAVFISVGRLDAEKSVDYLIRTFMSMKLPAEQAVLLLIGSGQQEEELRALTETSGGSIRLIGSVPHEEIRPYYHASDYYVTASLSEMHSIAMLEAMASGLFTLMRRDEENVWQIEPDVNGLIWDDEACLKAKVALLLAESPEEKDARRQNVVAWSKRHDCNYQVETLLSIYEDAIAEFAAANQEQEKVVEF